MTKTLVALYDTGAEAERVVQALLADGFARSAIHLTLHHTQGCAAYHASPERDVAYAGAQLVKTFIALGAPQDQAYAYAKGVRRGGALVVVESRDDQAQQGMEILRRLHPVNMQERAARWRQEGWTGSDAPTSAAAPPRRSQEQPRATPRVADQGAHTRPIAGHEAVTIPVVEEDLVISTQEVERGTVRIYSRVTAQPVEEAVRLREERITVERRPADRPATAADIAAAAQQVLELTETVEEPVVRKQARVVEEVVVQKEVAEHTETVRGTARHTEVEVQRAPQDATAAGRATALQGFAAYDATFREHYTTAFTTSGAPYAVYEPAYRYGYELGTNERYRGRDWAALEAEARCDWEARHPSTWERCKEAVRYGWNRVRTRT
jgi:stress response protein YsnF